LSKKKEGWVPLLQRWTTREAELKTIAKAAEVQPRTVQRDVLALIYGLGLREDVVKALSR
jgi:hypothetical protein